MTAPPDSLTRLWPRPRRVERLEGSCRTERGFRIDAPADLRAMEDRLRLALGPDAAGVGEAVRDATPVRLVRGPDATHGRGGYELLVRAGAISIDAADAAGAWNAGCTLAQLARLRAAGAAEIPCVAIRDAPDFARRGVLLDVSRSRVPTMATLFGLVDWLARLKIDELQLYTEHTFAYRGHEIVWKDASPVTPDEARELDAFCAARGVELVPNQQSFGHMHRWLAHERYRHLAEVPEGLDHAFSIRREPFALCPLDPGSLALLEDLYDQLLPNFSSRQLGVGLDETFDLGLGRSKAACAERGTGRVYLDFLREVHRRVAERGRRMQFWGDIVLQHPELIAEVPRDAIALAWGYEEGHPFAENARAFAESGLEFRVCPGTSSWQSVAGRTRNAVANSRSAAVHGRAHGASGYLITDWGDRGHLQPLPVSYAGFLLGAGLAWNASAADGEIPLADLLDAHAFADRAGVLGRATIELGDAGLETGSPATNGSALFFLLAFARDALPHPRTPGLTAEGLERSLDFVLARRARLDRADPDREDGALLVDEMRWAADTLAFACRFGLARLRAAPGGPVAAIQSAERARLSAELEPLIAEHRRLWLRRSRPGGLDESAGWLERVLELLREAR